MFPGSIRNFTFQQLRNLILQGVYYEKKTVFIIIVAAAIILMMFTKCVGRKFEAGVKPAKIENDSWLRSAPRICSRIFRDRTFGYVWQAARTAKHSIYDT